LIDADILTHFPSGPLYPPDTINESTYSSCEEAMAYAYAEAGNLCADDIDFWGLYDCFPISLVRALEACGLCDNGGNYLQQQYGRMIRAMEDDQVDRLLQDPTFFPVNTHGGLLCFGAPWEVPAMYNIIEAVHQIRGKAKGRQMDCRRALVYGNGGILSASAVAILAKSL
jgi:acetyl-CoA acetyltransferase